MFSTTEVILVFLFSKEHKFCLSSENSVCRDYVTEKMFAQTGHLLPIVLKRSIYKVIVLDNAFIAADDFKCPQDLTKHLDYLGSNYSAFSNLGLLWNYVRSKNMTV